ncbi:Bug family tripartite tricarboxylate transporter substrate binding protein [Roseomonas xinghualingensis]|uniref:Bug family tripartite tricarboxylate transporter substrate binding protein n=1 Tax=Roseomonas xinghualingensis TaxID=2986475 RepID=UPI0021F0EE63|nr:tripartite tricarboxylate transporter substrate binding protein [Roseomonas sp. SXEYE001]MCV4207174.1 tripartite tricarboxylate transporter substrate binding protein [Roseomonas sp. SXEYE001]
MTMQRRTLLATGALALPALARAQGAWPNRPIRLLVGFAPGGAVDIAARLLAPALSTRLGQAVVVENRPGAGANIAAEAVANATPDGHVLLLATPGPLTINPAIYEKLAFEPERGFAPVARLGNILDVLAVPGDRPWRSVADVLAATRAKPGEVVFSSSGIGSGSHLGIILLEHLANISVLHVSYRGGGPMMGDFLSGKLDATVGTGPVLVPLGQAGRIHLLGVASGERSRLLPNVPSIAETAPGYEMGNWFGLAAPASTPPEVVARLHGAAAEAMMDPALAARFSEQAVEPALLGPAEFGAFLAAERTRWSPLLKAAGVRVD